MKIIIEMIKKNSFKSTQYFLVELILVCWNEIYEYRKETQTQTQIEYMHTSNDRSTKPSSKRVRANKWAIASEWMNEQLR